MNSDADTGPSNGPSRSVEPARPRIRAGRRPHHRRAAQGKAAATPGRRGNDRVFVGGAQDPTAHRGGLDLVLDHVSQRRLDDLPRVVGPLRRPVPERRPEVVGNGWQRRGSPDTGASSAASTARSVARSALGTRNRRCRCRAPAPHRRSPAPGRRAGRPPGASCASRRGAFVPVPEAVRVEHHCRHHPGQGETL